MLNALFKQFSIISIILILSVQADAELDALFDMSIEELLQVEVEGATRTSQSLLTVPSSVSVFSHEEIKHLGVNTLFELMNYAPGFQSRRSGTTSIINKATTRGHNSGGSSRDILVLIDGQRVNTDNNGGVGIQYAMIPLENVKQVEFIRGAGSSLYGSNAFSSVINITTLHDINKLNVRLSTHAYQANAQFSVEDENTLFSGFIKGVKDTGQDYSKLKDTLGNGQTDSDDPYHTIDLYLQAQYKALKFYIAHNERKVENFYLLRRLSDENERETKNTYLRMRYDADINEAYKTQFSFSYLYAQDELFTELQPQGAIFANAPLFGKATLNEEIPSVEWFNSYAFNPEHSLQFGAEYRRPNMKEVRVQYNYDIINTPPQNPFYNPNYYTFALGKESARDIYGVYGQYQGAFFSQLHLTLGLRYDNYSDFGNSLNPRVALVYEALEKTSFKLLYSRAFRAPSRNELDLVNNGVLVGNPDLDPELINAYEAIVVQEYQGHSLSLSYYVNQIDDIILGVDVPNSNQIKRQNVGDGEFTGVELEYIGNLTPYLQARASYSHIFTKPDFAYQSSNNLASAILNYHRQDYNINLSAFYHSSAQNNDNGVLHTLDAYTLVNTKLSYQLTHDTSVYFQMKNIFDEAYYAPTEGSSLSVDIPNRTRESFIGLEINF